MNIKRKILISNLILILLFTLYWLSYFYFKGNLEWSVFLFVIPIYGQLIFPLVFIQFIYLSIKVGKLVKLQFYLVINFFIMYFICYFLLLYIASYFDY